MNDLETRLAEGLAGTAERAPRPTDLATGARTRLRRRRRTSATVVAAALAVVAVPVTVALVGDGPGGGPDRGDTSTASEVPSDWRTETWHDLSFRVPPSWDWGGGADWCTSGRSVEATVPQTTRPGGVIPAIACSPSFGYGVHFLQPSGGELPPGTEGAVQQYHGDTYPDGAWIGYVSTGSAAAWVVTAERALTRQVLDSATPVGDVDPNGCPAVTLEEPETGPHLVVCRYDHARLVQSEVLADRGTRRAATALRAAPAPGAGDGRECIGERPEVVTMVGGGVKAVVVPGCGSLSVSGARRHLTPEVLYWALSPGWSGAVPHGVRLPDRLRGQ